MNVRFIVLILQLLLSVSAFAATQGLDIRNKPRVVDVLKEENGHYVVRDIWTRQRYTLNSDQISMALKKGESVDGVRIDDYVKFTIVKKIGGEEIVEVNNSQAKMVFQNGIALVTREMDPKCKIDCSTETFFIPTTDLIKTVESLPETSLRVGDDACLVKRVGSFNEGTCGRVMRIFSNGDVHINTFSLLGLRYYWGEYDFDAHYSLLKKENGI